MKKIVSLMLVVGMLISMTVSCVASTASVEPVYFEDFSKSSDTYTRNSDNTDHYTVVAENGRLVLTPKEDKSFYAYQLPGESTISGATELTVAVTFKASGSTGIGANAGLQCIMTPAFGIEGAGTFSFAGHCTSTDINTQYAYGHAENGAYAAGTGASDYMLNYQNKLGELAMDTEYIMVVEMTKSSLPIVTYYDTDGNEVLKQAYTLSEMRDTDFDFSNVADFDGPLGFVVRHNTYGGTCTLNAFAAYTSTGIDHATIISKLINDDTNRATPNPKYFNDFSDTTVTYQTGVNGYTAEMSDGKLTLSRTATTDFYAYTFSDSPTISGQQSLSLAVKFTPATVSAEYATMTTAFGISDDGNDDFLYAGYSTGKNDTALGNQSVYGKVVEHAHQKINDVTQYNYRYLSADTSNYGPFVLDTETEYIMIVEMTASLEPIITYYRADTGERLAYYGQGVNTGIDFSTIASFDGKLGLVIRNGACKGIYDSFVAYEACKVDHSAVIAQLNSGNNVCMQIKEDNSAIRFVGVIDLAEEELAGCETLGFDIKMTYNGTVYSKSDIITTVYDSVVADNETIYAKDYGGTYFYVVEINGIDGANGDIALEVIGKKDGASYDKVNFTVADLDYAITSMSFNIYYETGETNNYGVPDRVNKVTQMILSRMPDTVGLQECTAEWLEILKNKLGSSYGCIEGNLSQAGQEYCPIFYRKDKLEVVWSKSQWLSDTPDEESTVDGAALCRVVTYAKLRRISDEKEFICANTHLDHLSNAVGAVQAEKMLGLLSEYSDMPVVLTGDFNNPPSTKAHSLINLSYLKSSADIAALSKKETTIHCYGAANIIIDYVFVNEAYMYVYKYEVCNEKIDGYYASDHHPIVSTFLIK